MSPKENLWKSLEQGFCVLEAVCVQTNSVEVLKDDVSK